MIRSAFDLASSLTWAMEPDALTLLLQVADRQGSEAELLATREGRPLQAAPGVTMRGDIAVVSLLGPLFRRANLFTEISGATSTEMFIRDLQTAADDPAVKGLVLFVDSPGGDANGINEAAKAIADIRGRKPVVAYVGGAAASGAYWLASAADEIVVDDTALLGSIGAVSRNVSTRGRDEKSGTRVIEIVSTQSPLKRVDVETDEGRAVVQALIDDLAQVFIRAVADYRGVDEDTVINKFGRGGVLMGAKAVNAGMADRIGTLETLLAEMNRQARPGGTGPSRVMQKDVTMTEKTPAVATGIQPGDITVAFLSTNFAAVADALRAEGRTAGHAEGLLAGAKGERERIAAIEAVALPGYDTIIAAAKADGVSTGADVAQKIVAEQKRAGVATVAALADADRALPEIKPGMEPPPAPPKVDASAPIEDRAKATWDADAGLRAEFGGNFNGYLAFARAEADGRVRRLGGK